MDGHGGVTDPRVERAADLRARGHTYRQIAAETGVSEMTVVRWLNPRYRQSDNERKKLWNATQRAKESSRQREYRRWAERAWQRMTDEDRRLIAHALADLELPVSDRNVA